MTRRELLRSALRLLTGFGAGGVAAGLTLRGRQPITGPTVWQIDPDVCVQCGNCETECVLAPSAVKCVHAFDVCGYCDLCSGYLQQGATALNTSAESRLCPTDAIIRTYIEDPYYEYVIDEALCIACGRCVKGCSAFGNGSLFLQIRHDRCVNCNACSIARRCPSGAIRRVSADTPYLLKGERREG